MNFLLLSRSFLLSIEWGFSKLNLYFYNFILSYFLDIIFFLTCVCCRWYLTLRIFLSKACPYLHQSIQRSVMRLWFFGSNLVLNESVTVAFRITKGCLTLSCLLNRSVKHHLISSERQDLQYRVEGKVHWLSQYHFHNGIRLLVWPWVNFLFDKLIIVFIHVDCVYMFTLGASLVFFFFGGNVSLYKS